VDRVTANAVAVNTQSRRVMEKAGLSFLRNFTGDWPEAIAGSEHGEVEHDLIRADWEQRRGPSTVQPEPAAPLRTVPR
jgi:RimJ/RimL family protein N-acetyltransferase